MQTLQNRSQFGPDPASRSFEPLCVSSQDSFLNMKHAHMSCDHSDIVLLTGATFKKCP